MDIPGTIMAGNVRDLSSGGGIFLVSRPVCAVNAAAAC